jgi:hypothetical protein
MSLMRRLWTAKQSRSALRDHAGVARGSGAIRFQIPLLDLRHQV